MGAPFAIRYPFLAIVLLGVLTSALSLGALVRTLTTMTEAQRLERAEDNLQSEVARLSTLAPSTSSLAALPVTSLIGMRAGWVDSVGAVASVGGMPITWYPLVADAVKECLTEGGRNSRTVPQEDGTLLISTATSSVATGQCVFAAKHVFPSSYSAQWRLIVAALALATVLLVATTLWGAFAFRRNTTLLGRTLVALGHDLQTPVPQPRIAELVAIADGIRSMADALLRSREATERLGKELAQKERLAALGRVAAGVAHEVRNPLASIKLRLDLTRAQGGLPETTTRAIDAATAEIERLDRLVSDLLVVAGRRSGPRETLDLLPLARSRVEALQPWAEAHGVGLAVEGSGQTIADAEALGRAVDNLVRNAVEAAPPGTLVALRVLQSDAGTELRVEDSGTGVPEDRVTELFEPFFTTKAEGTGLGLAISRSIARAHGGDVAYTREGRTTRFSLTLPREPGVAA